MGIIKGEESNLKYSKKLTRGKTIIIALIILFVFLMSSHLLAQSSRFTVSRDEVITDAKSGLQWFIGPDRDTDWDSAKAWVGSLKVDGGCWRMPGAQELEGLYGPLPGAGKPRQVSTPVLKKTANWTIPYYNISPGQKTAPKAYYFVNACGDELNCTHDHTPHPRALAVRSSR
jgi:hypothetical protein